MQRNSICFVVFCHSKFPHLLFCFNFKDFGRDKKNPLRDLSLQIGETGGNVAVCPVSTASAVARLALAPHGGMHSAAGWTCYWLGHKCWPGKLGARWKPQLLDWGVSTCRGGDNGLPTPADLLTSRAELERKVTSRQLEHPSLALDLAYAALAP